MTPTALFSAKFKVDSNQRRDGQTEQRLSELWRWRLLTGIMRHVGGGVEKSVDAVAAVTPHHREAVGLSVFLDDVAQLSVANSGLH